MSLDGATIQTLMDVLDERTAQDTKWGRQDHPNGTGTAGLIRMADVAREHCQSAFRDDRGTWADVLTEEFYEALAESDPAKLRTELIQTAAVCVAWVEAIDRRQT